MSNIAEGFKRNRRAEFHQFLSTPKPVRSQLYVAFDIGYIDKGTFERILQQAEEVARIIGGLRVSVEKQRDAQGSNLNAQLRKSPGL